MALPQPSREATRPDRGPGLITISLCGDVMTGRGIDQALRHPGDPTLFEPYVTDARRYLEMAQEAHGPVPIPLDDAYVWGDALAEWERVRPDLRIVNLETSITTSDEAWPGKEVLYRMNPANVGCLVAARLDCCTLANNHVLDWGRQGLVETVQTLEQAGLKFAGAGRDQAQAEAPALVSVAGKGRVVVLACGSVTSGIPRQWAAGADRPGVNLLEDFSEQECRRIGEAVRRVKRGGDVVVLSIHWGPNWGFPIPRQQRQFAHWLIDEAGVDVVYGHSCHHVQAIEVHRGKLILYGCGDFLDDYEGISGYEEFRSDLGLLYFAAVNPVSGELVGLEMIPTTVRRLRIERAGGTDALWLQETLDRESRPFGAGVKLTAEGTLKLRWQSATGSANR